VCACVQARANTNDFHNKYTLSLLHFSLLGRFERDISLYLPQLFPVIELLLNQRQFGGNAFCQSEESCLLMLTVLVLGICV
jgi:hypothetical protein